MASTSSSKALPLLIAGGGIGGLTAALCLARKGCASHVLEQAADFAEVGAGIQLGPNIFKVLDALGLADAVDAVAFFPDHLIMRDSTSGDEIVRMPVGSRQFAARFKYRYGVIYRPDLLDVLLKAAKRSPLITLSTKMKVVDFDDSGHGDGDPIVAITASGERIEGAALIGADGLWSRVRERVIGDGKPQVSGHIAYRAVLPIEAVEERLRPNSVVLWAGPKRHLVHYPLRRGELFNLVAVFHSDRYDEGWDVFGDPAELVERFRDAAPEVRALLAKIETWKMWVLCDREPVRNWSSGRVGLLGDAAHPMLQYLAQGACMAVEDAYVLADQVDRHGDAHHGDYAAAFVAYQNERYLRAARVQLTARFYGEIYHAGGVKAEVRNQMFRASPPQPSVEAMGWLYDGIATR